jgi:hypothetical protein
MAAGMKWNLSPTQFLLSFIRKIVCGLYETNPSRHTWLLFKNRTENTVDDLLLGRCLSFLGRARARRFRFRRS